MANSGFCSGIFRHSGIKRASILLWFRVIGLNSITRMRYISSSKSWSGVYPTTSICTLWSSEVIPQPLPGRISHLRWSGRIVQHGLMQIYVFGNRDRRWCLKWRISASIILFCTSLYFLLFFLQIWRAPHKHIFCQDIWGAGVGFEVRNTGWIEQARNNILPAAFVRTDLLASPDQLHPPGKACKYPTHALHQSSPADPLDLLAGPANHIILDFHHSCNRSRVRFHQEEDVKEFRVSEDTGGIQNNRTQQTVSIRVWASVHSNALLHSTPIHISIKSKIPKYPYFLNLKEWRASCPIHLPISSIFT